MEKNSNLHEASIKATQTLNNLLFAKKDLSNLNIEDLVRESAQIGIIATGIQNYRNLPNSDPRIYNELWSKVNIIFKRYLKEAEKRDRHY